MGCQRATRKTKGQEEETAKEDLAAELTKMEHEWEKKLEELSMRMEERIDMESRKWEVQVKAAEARIQSLEEELKNLKQPKEQEHFGIDNRDCYLSHK